ncbi:serine/threonine-protein kinase [Spirulina sp. CS-785/01]|uniref:serine/threonine-protein kinase n=1 Tax=Spirulina sp. CS-785/01 TaxID=3021716 RepID=UPI00232BC027|nr:serine/threonine-protein kinase [Spirulina sp. CS-785/01]MDB9316024.1 serine/threonine-protein kinase [Spirulina sp. CS-785/01]
MVSFVEVGALLSDRYHILRELGKGTMGCTYLAEDRQQGNARRAISEFRVNLPQEALRQKAEQLFRQEAEILSRLDHPQIPRVYELLYLPEEGQDRVLVVRDYVEGQTLRTLLKARWVQGRTFNEIDGLRCLQQLLPVLNYLHSMGIIHRDIAPDNILLRQKDNRLVLFDFGGIKQILTTLETERTDPSTNPQATTLAHRLGRPGYAPPEQLRKGIIYTYSDLYALAATVLVLLTGKEPLELYDERSQGWTWDAEVEISPQLAEILRKMLAQQPSDRFQNAYDVLKALRQVPKPKTPKDAQGKESQENLPASPPSSSSASGDQNTVKTVKRLGRLLLQTMGVLGFTVGAGVGGWFLGQTWLKNQVSQSSPRPELEVSPVASPVEVEVEESPEPLSFPPLDDPEPEPSDQLPPAERERKLALRDRRLELAIDYEFFQSLLNQRVWAKYPEMEGQTPDESASDKIWRDRWDETATQLLEKLSTLGGEARRGLGRYRQVELERMRQELTLLNLTPPTLNLLADARFFHLFPEQRDKEFQYRPIGQIWRAIALDKLQNLQAEKTLETVVFPPGETSQTVKGELNPGDGQVYLMNLGENQKLSVTVVTNQAVKFAIHGPNEPLFTSKIEERTWSGTLPKTGYYQLVITSRSAQPLDYQITISAQ